LNQTTIQDRGSNQAGMRAHNERLVLTLVRRHGGLAKADIARSTGLSAQTVSVIMRSLEDDGLLVRGTPIKGRVGQPSVPMHLAADGAYAIGLKIGRRSAELALMDFLGRIEEAPRHQLYPYPTPDGILDFAQAGINALLESLPAAHRDRVAGVGVAMPFELWNWADEVGGSTDEMAVWQGLDLAAALAERTGLPVFVQNDATAACGAELLLGCGAEHADFVYAYIGFFVGGGVVLNNAVYPGRSGNAGALGSMPMPARNGRARQLIDEASIFVLEQRLRHAGRDPAFLWQRGADWRAAGPLLDAWIDDAGRAVAQAIIASSAVIDFPVAIIDGAFPVEVRAAMVGAVDRAMAEFDLQGIHPPAILAGAVGSAARVVGGAFLPFFARYLVDQSVLFKTDE
jgi:predicted NBD/HSP70 family sugar kinase